MQDTRLHWLAEFSIHEGKREEFTRLARDIIAAVDATESKALVYEWYISADGRTCVVDEWYADADAARAHLNGEAPKLLPGILEVSTFTGLRVFGDVSCPELKALLSSFGAVFCGRMGGITR